MGQRSRSKSDRTHQHTDFSKSVNVLTEDDLHELLDNNKEPFLLILDEVQDPHNLGACLRTADGAGVDAVIVPKDRSVGLTDTVRRIACGGAERVPLIQVTNLARCLKELKERSIWLIGTTDKAQQTLYEMDLKGSLALVLGAEGKGLRRLTKEHCDFIAHIPMAAGAVDCLNVSVAAGICLFEAVRQRGQTAV